MSDLSDRKGFSSPPAPVTLSWLSFFRVFPIFAPDQKSVRGEQCELTGESCPFVLKENYTSVGFLLN